MQSSHPAGATHGKDRLNCYRTLNPHEPKVLLVQQLRAEIVAIGADFVPVGGSKLAFIAPKKRLKWLGILVIFCASLRAVCPSEPSAKYW